MEYTTCKFTSLDCKSDGDVGVIEGLGSHFDNVDSGGDVIRAGAFTETIGAKLPKMLWQHDPAEVIGKWDATREVDDGLHLSGRLALKTQRGLEAFELAKMGAIDGLSIGFTIPSGGATLLDNGIREIKQIDLWEVSVVTFPMNELARVTAVKSRLAHGEKISERDLEALLRDAGLSKQAAVAIVATGYAGLGKSRDDLADLSHSIMLFSRDLKNGTFRN
jgi:HK97 family phage prohead protease